MAGKATKIQRAAVKEAAVQDQLILQFESELEGVLRRADRLIGNLVRDVASEKGRFVRTRAALGRAIRLRQDLVKAIDSAGFTDLATEATSVRFDALAARVLADVEIAAPAADLTRVATQAITALKELRLADLLEWRDGVAHSAWRITVDGILGLRKVEHLVGDLSALLDVSAQKARTIYDTAVSTFSRQVQLLESSGKPDELFYYAGPVDDITRPFCLTHVGRVLSRVEIDRLDNGQLPDPLVTGGGYNCRHAFKRVSLLDQELIDLHTSGGRLPHVQQQLDALNKQKAA